MARTIVVKDEQEGPLCPSAALFQNMDPGIKQSLNHAVKVIFLETLILKILPLLSGSGFYSTCAILLINRMLSRDFCSLS